MLNITRWQQAAFQNRWCFEHQREERMRHKIIVRKHEWGEFCKTFGNGRVKKTKWDTKTTDGPWTEQKVGKKFNFKTFVHPGVNESIRLIWQVDWIFFSSPPDSEQQHHWTAVIQPHNHNPATLIHYSTEWLLVSSLNLLEKKKISTVCQAALSLCVYVCTSACLYVCVCLCVCVDEPFSQC